MIELKKMTREIWRRGFQGCEIDASTAIRQHPAKADQRAATA